MIFRWFCLVILFTLSSRVSHAGDPLIMHGLKLESMTVKSPKFVAAADVIVIDSSTALILSSGQPNSGIRNAGKLSFIDLKSDRSAKPMSLPEECSRVALAVRPGRAARDILCFGKKAGADDNLLVYAGAGKFSPLLKTPKKIFAAGGTADRIFFVSGDGLYQIRPKDGVRPVFASSLLVGVKSLVVDGENDVLYLATANEVMSLRGGILDVLVQGMGGHLSLIGKDIVLVDPNGRVFRLTGLSELLVKKN